MAKQLRRVHLRTIRDDYARQESVSEGIDPLFNEPPDDRLTPMMDCAWHGYSERSTRDKLARHRARSDVTVRAWFHGLCNQWHVETWNPTDE